MGDHRELGSVLFLSSSSRATTDWLSRLSGATSTSHHQPQGGVSGGLPHCNYQHTAAATPTHWRPTHTERTTTNASTTTGATRFPHTKAWPRSHHHETEIPLKALQNGKEHGSSMKSNSYTFNMDK